MNQSKINLLVDKEDYRNVERIFRLARYFILVLSMYLFLAAFNFNKANKERDSKINSLNEQKKTLLVALGSKKENQAKIIFIKNKYSALKTYLAEDAQILPYYDLLKSTLAVGSDSAKIDNFHVDSDRNIDFIVVFKNIDELTNFYRIVESDDFLKNFEKLNMSSISTKSFKDNNQSYQLTFTGRLIKLNEK